MTDSKSRFEAGDLCTVRLTERDAQYLNTGNACYFSVEHIVESQQLVSGVVRSFINTNI